MSCDSKTGVPLVPVAPTDGKTALLPWFFDQVNSDGLIDDDDFHQFCTERSLPESTQRSERRGRVPLPLDPLRVEMCV
jgi:hypothetical protein